MKIKLLSLLCALLLLVGALPAASALDGEALRSANTLAALNLVDSAGAACSENIVSRNACEAPATPERTGLKYSGSSSLNAGMTAVQVTSGVTAPIWQAKASRKVPYVPMTTCSPPKSRTALRMARDVEARLAEGTPPIAKQLKSPCHPRMFIKETT